MNTSKIKLVHRVEFIKEMCKGKKVLHLGCTNYPYTLQSLDDKSLLHFELLDATDQVYGFDLDQSGIDILQNAGVKNLYQADLENLDAVDLDETFDVIVAGEMIEHLANPGLFLRGIRRFMNPQTKLLITTINAYSGLRFWLYGLRGRQGEIEPVHPDHLAYYSYSTLKLLISRANLDVREFLFYDVGPEHRAHNRWYYNLCNDICVKIAPQWSDGVIAVCQLPEN